MLGCQRKQTALLGVAVLLSTASQRAELDLQIKGGQLWQKCCMEKRRSLPARPGKVDLLFHNTSKVCLPFTNAATFLKGWQCGS